MSEGFITFMVPSRKLPEIKVVDRPPGLDLSAEGVTKSQILHSGEGKPKVWRLRCQTWCNTSPREGSGFDSRMNLLFPFGKERARLTVGK